LSNEPTENNVTIQLSSFLSEFKLLICPNTEASSNLQSHLDKIDKWASNWKIKINAEKSFHVPFTLRKEISPVLYFGRIEIPIETKIKYLGLILDKRLTWGQHLKSTRKKLNSRLHLLRLILKSNFSLENK